MNHVFQPISRGKRTTTEVEPPDCWSNWLPTHIQRKEDYDRWWTGQCERFHPSLPTHIQRKEDYDNLRTFAKRFLWAFQPISRGKRTTTLLFKVVKRILCSLPTHIQRKEDYDGYPYHRTEFVALPTHIQRKEDYDSHKTSRRLLSLLLPTHIQRKEDYDCWTK